MCEHKVSFLSVVNYATLNRSANNPLICEKCRCELRPEPKYRRLLTLADRLRNIMIAVIFVLYLFVRTDVWIFVGVLTLYFLLELGFKYTLWRKMKYEEI